MLSTDRLPCWARAGLAAVVLLRPAAAGADVVSPPPTHCPPGTLAETSHRGPECVKDAPRNCPHGWHGVVGGTCSLTPCTGDEECRKGEACVEHSTCLESVIDNVADYTDDPRGGRGRLSQVTRFNAWNLCAADVPCSAPLQCSPEKICVPRGTRGLPYFGDVTPARVAREIKMPAAATSSTPPSTPAPGAIDAGAPPPPTAPSPGTPPPGTAPVSGGCAGCATAGSSSVPLFGLPLLGLAALLVARRRR